METEHHTTYLGWIHSMSSVLCIKMSQTSSSNIFGSLWNFILIVVVHVFFLIKLIGERSYESHSDSEIVHRKCRRINQAQITLTCNISLIDFWWIWNEKNEMRQRRTHSTERLRHHATLHYSFMRNCIHHIIRRGYTISIVGNCLLFVELCTLYVVLLLLLIFCDFH